MHFIITAILAATLYPFYNWMVAFLFVGAILVDSDHVLWYWFKHKQFSPTKTFKYCTDIEKYSDIKEYKGAIMIFHTWDALLISFIIALFSNIFLMIFIGLAVHLICDFLYSYKLFKGFNFQYLFKKSSIKFLWKKYILTTKQ